MGNTVKTELKIVGMHCAACELVVEKKVAKLPGVKRVDAKLSSHSIELDLESNVNQAELVALINEAIEKDGYKIVDDDFKHQVNWRELGIAFAISAAFVTVFLLLEQAGLANILNFGAGQLPLPAIFLIGVVASLSSCMAVVGGLVLTISSNFAKIGSTVPLVLFHVGRVIGFFILGGVIGLIGSAFRLSTGLTLIVQVALVIVMLLMGLSQLQVLPGLNKFQLRAPKRFGKKVMEVSQYTNMVVPALLGVLTFILPCGFTQSMQLYALSTGSFIQGALTMVVFALGTLPVLGLISFASVKLANSLKSGIFFKTAGFLIIFFAILNLLSVINVVTALG